MFDCHSRLNTFYDEKVRLRDKHKQLREYRDKNIERVIEGTTLLSEEEDKDHPKVIDDFSQGSMAMHTINQAQNDDDHDIDHALIYDEGDVPDDPKELREFVARAVAKAGGNFKTEPEARTNAVTIWYEDGYHVDFALYKAKEGWLGDVTYYHAGADWTKRDPKAITEWFSSANSDLSPTDFDWGKKVADNQLRRLVRFAKFWAKSRDTWSMPSGLVISVLIIECYKKDVARDDLAFLNTLRAVANRLVHNKEVLNPTDQTLSLLTDDGHHKQIVSLQEKLSSCLDNLETSLKDSKCDQAKAWKAWGKFYLSSWWSADLARSEVRGAILAESPIKVEVAVFRKANTLRAKYEPNGNQVIPKGMNIRFTLKPSFPMPYTVRWEVQNSGDEAGWSNQSAPRPGQVDRDNQNVCTEKSAFRGNHKVICEVTKDGRVYTSEIPVRIR